MLKKYCLTIVNTMPDQK